MGPSKVYFTDMRALPGTNLQQKLKRLILKAGIGQIDFQDKYAAIKSISANRATFLTCGLILQRPLRTP